MLRSNRHLTLILGLCVDSFSRHHQSNASIGIVDSKMDWHFSNLFQGREYTVLQYNGYYRQIWTDGFDIVAHLPIQTSKGGLIVFCLPFAYTGITGGPNTTKILRENRWDELQFPEYSGDFHSVLLYIPTHHPYFLIGLLNPIECVPILQ